VVPLKEGDIFSAEKIREALDNLKHLDSSHGYLDFVATPLTDMDESNRVISLTFELDQEQQYRVGTIEITGLAPDLESRLKWPHKPGDIFDSSKFEEFFVDNKSILPEGASSDDSEIRRNPKNATVSLRFSLGPCQSPVN
jgi:outer membrane protein assembly factor BamA